MTGREAPSAEILLKRLALRETQIAARHRGHLGFAGAHLGNHANSNADLTCAFPFRLHLIVLTKRVSSRKTPKAGASVSAPGTNENEQGFSSIDLAALANDTLTLANAPTTANSLGLDDEANDAGYIATVQIGTPPRNFNILMDSGSADFWVGSEGCQSVDGGGCVGSSPILANTLISHLGVGQSRVSRTPILIFVRGYKNAFPSTIWFGSRSGNYHHRQYRHRGLTACWSHFWRGRTRNR